MELNIISKDENKLLNRNEIRFECLYQGEATPKLLDIKNKLVAMVDADKNLLVIDKVDPLYGEGKARGYAKLYFDAESLDQIEAEHIKIKNKEIVKEEEPEEE